MENGRNVTSMKVWLPCFLNGFRWLQITYLMLVMCKLKVHVMQIMLDTLT